MSNITHLQTPSSISFYVPGIPATQGSKTLAHANGNVWMRERNAAQLKVWRDAVIVIARQAANRARWHVEADTPVKVEVLFYLPKPPTSKRPNPTAQRDGDLDKLQRAVGDAIVQAGVLADDSQITTWNATKAWTPPQGQPGAWITVTNMITNQEMEKAA
jgi:Holliday junction resolvase RusA-like endonuclease